MLIKSPFRWVPQTQQANQPVLGADPTPTLSAASATVQGCYAADLDVTTDVGNGTLYWVIDASATPPSAAQVKLGQDNGGAAADLAGSQTVTGVGAQAIRNAIGLAEVTAYGGAYLMHETAAAVQSTVTAIGGFTTKDNLQSNPFALNTGWSTSQATISANAVANPTRAADVTADKLQQNTTNAAHFVGNTAIGAVVVDATNYTFEVYAKAGELTWTAILADGTGGAYFDIVNGTVGNNHASGAPLTKTIAAVGDGWFRLRVTELATGTVYGATIYLASANGTVAYAGGDTTSGNYFWGMQVYAT